MALVTFCLSNFTGSQIHQPIHTSIILFSPVGWLQHWWIFLVVSLWSQGVQSGVQSVPLVHWGARESSVFLVRLLTPLRVLSDKSCPLGKLASWKELKEQVCYIVCPEKCAVELCPKCLLVLWTSKHELALWHPCFLHLALWLTVNWECGIWWHF